MCGIAGVARYERSPEAGDVATMLERLAHRGPDGSGIWQDQRACLGHRRLSVLDLSTAANQPMIDDSGRYVIVFNGEIYNFRQLRQTCWMQARFSKPPVIPKSCSSCFAATARLVSTN